MTYEFTTDKVGSLKLQHFKGTTETYSIAGVNAQETDASIIIGGLNQFLSIANFQNAYYPEYVTRTVHQNVVASE